MKDLAQKPNPTPKPDLLTGEELVQARSLAVYGAYVAAEIQRFKERNGRLPSPQAMILIVSEAHRMAEASEDVQPDIQLHPVDLRKPHEEKCD